MGLRFRNIYLGVIRVEVIVKILWVMRLWGWSGGVIRENG